MPTNAGPRWRSAETSEWRDFSGTPVRLTLSPDAGDLPPLHGRLVRALPGYFGVLRHLLELNEPLPSGFDPFGELPWLARARRRIDVAGSAGGRSSFGGGARREMARGRVQAAPSVGSESLRVDGRSLPLCRSRPRRAALPSLPGARCPPDPWAEENRNEFPSCVHATWCHGHPPGGRWPWDRR